MGDLRAETLDIAAQALARPASQGRGRQGQA